MKWKIPPRIKVYEALGCLVDKRIKINDNTAEVTSSSRNKKYLVQYDSKNNAITANDNGSYWQGYLGYPAIAFLLAKNIINCDRKLFSELGSIAWKDLNSKFKNDFIKTENFILERVTDDNLRSDLENEAERILRSIKELSLNKLRTIQKPPPVY